MIKIIPREKIKHLEWSEDTTNPNRENILRKVKVFIASPSDVAEERDITSYVVAEINRIFNDLFSIEIEAIRWESHSYPDVGEDSQDVINKQISEFDIFVGIMWKRYGTPTKRSSSGTNEEFERAYRLFQKYNKPKIMFYFRTTPFYSSKVTEINQFKKVLQFKNKLANKGVLYWEYNDSLTFERNVREHLIRQIFEKIKSPKLITERKETVDSKTKISTEYDFSPFSVFFTYSHLDKNIVLETYNLLKSNGLNVWLDSQNLIPGQMWANEINNALKRTDLIIVFISTNTFSKRGFISKEIELVSKTSKENTKNILIVRLDNTEPPEFLRQYIWIDLFLSDGLEKLLTAVLQIQSRSNKRRNN